MSYAMIFPGQGSQSVGMMAAYGPHPVIRDTFEEASLVLGEDFWSLVSDGPEAELARTVVTQPLMLTAGIAVWRLWQARGLAQPDWLAGHSLGEYTALVAAGALGFTDALRLTRYRAEVMQLAVPEGQGAMAAILGLDDAGVESACLSAAEGEVLEAANYNAPGQVVIAGTRAAVERGMVAAKALGAKRTVMLPMSVPSHCSLMREAAGKLATRLEDVAIDTPRIPVLHNYDMITHSEPEAVRRALVEQLYSPVRWSGTLRTLADRGLVNIAECGPGKVLGALCRRIDERLQGTALVDTESLDAFSQRMQEPRA